VSSTNPATDPKMRERPVKGLLKWFNRQRIGLILGPVLFLIIVLIPEPASMVDAAAAKGIGLVKAPQIALGTLAWVLV
jgi:hypothetical protein